MEECSKRFAWVGLALVTSLSGSRACDLCATFSAQHARSHSAPGLFAGVAEQFTHFATLQLDGQEVPDPSDQRLDSSISQVFAGYNFSRRVGVQLSLPVIYRSF